MKKKVLCIIGTRPEVIKMAPVIRALRAAPELEVNVESKEFQPIPKETLKSAILRSH